MNSHAYPPHGRPVPHLEPARRIELRLTPYQSVVLPLPLNRLELGKQDSDLHHPGPKPGGLPDCPIPHRSRLPASNGSPAPYKGAALPDELRRHGVLGATRTHITQLLRLVPLPLGYEDICGFHDTRSAPLVTALSRTSRPSLEPPTRFERVAPELRVPCSAR